MHPHEQRVIEEKTELAERLVKLSKFIRTSPVFENLPDEAQGLLREQWAAMLNYLNVLEMRIARFGGSDA